MSVLVVRVAAAEADACSDWLFQLGATAIEERTSCDDPTLVVGFASDEAALAARSILQERWACRLEDTGDERAWRDRWLEFLEPTEVAGFTIHAPWHDVVAVPADRRISIDPGRAFGSGHHPTTRLAIEALRRRVEPDDRVLDAGCGTGILAIITARLGAGAVTGADLDHDVLAIAEANVEANDVADRIRLTESSLLGLRERFDVIVANIVIGDLRPLMASLVDRCDRVLIVSGFLDSQFERLLADVDVSVVEHTRAEGWGCAVLAPVV